MTEDLPSLLALPAELIQQILSYLPPSSLAATSSTCHALNSQSSTDALWQAHVNANLSIALHSAAPLDSFRELYLAHHPYWFLPRHRIWISDSQPSGKLLLARYNPVKACIEAHTVAAERGPHTFEMWSHDRNVAIYSFNPSVKLHLDQPVLRLSAGRPRTLNNATPMKPIRNPFCKLREERSLSISGEQRSDLRLDEEITMDFTNSPGLRAAFALSRDLPVSLVSPATQMWPVWMIPAPSRTRNTSSSDYSSSGHRPTRLSEVSQNTFRLRKWVDYHGRRGSSGIAQIAGIDRFNIARGLFAQATTQGTSVGVERRGEQVDTFGTISPEAYIPTPRKPYRGIYCGDYSAHGCEFLLVLQPEQGTEDPLPQGMDWMREWLETGSRSSAAEPWANNAREYAGLGNLLAHLANQQGALQTPGIVPVARNEDDHDDDGDGDDEEDDTEDEDYMTGEEEADNRALLHEAADSRSTHPAPDSVRQQPPAEDETHLGTTEESETPSGRLIAIKLTGDPNIPRGQITFIAPDIGEKGFVRTADEEIFRGARIVRSAGHVAGRGFRNGKSRPPLVESEKY